jgi:hypothetical protein
MTVPRARLLAAGLAAGALAAPAAAAAVPVHVRVEGAKKTLLPDTRVTTNPGRIVGLTGSTTCSGGSGLGALDAATRGRWGGSYSASLGDYAVEQILGERHTFSSGSFWGIFVNDGFASTGLCGYQPKAGDELLLAASPGSGTSLPLAITAPKRAKVGKGFRVKVTRFTSSGAEKPAGRARVTGPNGLRGKTNGAGRLRLVTEHAGRVELTATRKNGIRDEVVVRVRRGDS